MVEGEGVGADGFNITVQKNRMDVKAVFSGLYVASSLVINFADLFMVLLFSCRFA